MWSGSASTTSSTTATCRHSPLWPAQPPRSRSGCGSRRTSPIVPFSHPLRLAEDLAMLDQLSGGRIEFGVGPRLRATRVPGVRLPDLAPRLAHRGVRRHPPPRVVGRALQLRRQALPVRRRAGDARPSPAWRPTAVDGGVEPARRRTGRPLRDARAAAGPRVAARRVARAKSRCGRRLIRLEASRDHPLLPRDRRSRPRLAAAARRRALPHGGLRPLRRGGGLRRCSDLQRRGSDHAAGLRGQRRRVRRRAHIVHPTLWVD